MISRHMSRIDINRSGELEAFVTVVDRGSFSAAARTLGVTPSAISKLVARLEARLGSRLVHRSTRAIQLTDEGRAYYDRGVRILADLDEAERNATRGAPRGRVRINTSFPVGSAVLLPLIPLLARLHPELEIDITLTDRVIDLVEERTDIAIRWGALPSSDLVARKLGETRQVIVGAPAYLRRAGTPRTVRDLDAHQRLGWSVTRSSPDWPLRVGRRIVSIPTTPQLRAADAETLRLLALSGMGLVRLSRYHVHADLMRGRLVPVLESLNPLDTAPIHAVFLGRPGRLAPRIRAVLDFLEEHATARLRTLA
jgi:DNA-binding transcriptional LysR family regulator